jgi:DNA-binding FadR family transcriptional regulator
MSPLEPFRATPRDEARVEVDSAVETTARRLRKQILRRAEPGIFLGSEEDLMARFQVSRNTLMSKSPVY